MNQRYLFDADFLYQLDLQQFKNIYVKVILLTFDELPIKETQGRVTSGSVNIDGASAVRRTCSLSMITDGTDINQIQWALGNKFKLEVGVENSINSKYPKIIWFNQGIYIFTSINMSLSTNNYTINLSGKDKMCLLNGEIGGSLTASIDFGRFEEEKVLDTGEIIIETKFLKIKDIIRNAVHVYGGELYSNIVLNDIDEYGVELLEWRGAEEAYMPRSVATGVITNMSTVWNENWNVEDGDKEYNEKNYNFYSLAPNADNSQATSFVGGNTKYNIVKIKYGETVGYRPTDLTYPGELIGNIGDSLVTILDKIKNMFIDFEYFYDIDGRFVFQKKKNYLNDSYNNIINQEDGIYIDALEYSSKYSYTFKNGILISSFANNPVISNIKNDYSIWGKRKSSTGSEISIHLREAIDIKPEKYVSIGVSENNKENNIKSQTSITYYSNSVYSSEEIKKDSSKKLVDWRELIYQMALDYYKYNEKLKDFHYEVLKNNSDGYYAGQQNHIQGKTGYEQYYIDLQGFWRQLYHPGVFDTSFITDSEKKKIARELLIDNGTSSTEITDEMIKEKIEELSDDEYKKYLEKDYNEDGWNKNIEEAPESLNFWFDFFGTNGELGKYSIQSIGHRPKVENNDKVGAIQYKETPPVLFLKENEEVDKSELTGYTFINLSPQFENYFSISAQGNSAQNQFESLLYNHAIIAESATITSLPIYYLEPNVRIHVYDEKTKINGDYIVSRITVPLQHNGTTSITATKVVDRIY